MEKKQISAEELEKSMQYLDAFAKGESPESIDDPKDKPEEKEEPEAEPDDELYIAHKNRMAAYLDKAMAHKGYMDKIRKGEPLPDEAFDDLEDEVKENKPEIKKGNETEELGQQQSIEDLVKAKVTEALDAQKVQSDAIIKGLQDQIQQLQEQPVRKTLIKGADAVTLKKAISGEKDEDNKTLLSVSLQKSKISEVLFQAWEAETDEIRKGQLSEAVAEFESTGSYISSEIAQIMEEKGFRFIK